MSEQNGIKAGAEEKGMKAGHVLDLKLPIGCLLSAYGVLLGVYGLVTKKEMYERSLGLNLNLVWGVLMVLIGGAFLLTAFVKRNGKK
jgi:protein-S-isoprenylcysteine O-methyltransferase Ste14